MSPKYQAIIVGIFSRLLFFKFLLLPMTSSLLENVQIYLLYEAVTRYINPISVSKTSISVPSDIIARVLNFALKIRKQKV